MIGPPFLICSLKIGITEPLEPSTLPNLTAANFVLYLLPFDCKIISVKRFEAPIAFVGFTALSVEIIINLSTSFSIATSITFFVPKTLFFIASCGRRSIKGTCLCAAAWNTTLGLYLSNTSAKAAFSRILTISEIYCISSYSLLCDFSKSKSRSSIYNAFSLTSTKTS